MSPGQGDLRARVRIVDRAVRVAEDSRALIAGLVTDVRTLRASREILVMPRGDRVAYRSDNVHPLFRDREALHPDNQGALQAAARIDLAEALAGNDIELWPDVFAHVEDSLVLVGSPTSEGYSREIFGYSPYEDGLRDDGDYLDMRWRWQLDSTKTERMAARYVPGLGIRIRPNWGLTDRGGSGDHPPIWTPSVADDDPPLVLKDYLLITRLPNLINDNALERGRYIASVAGLHGPGTRAIRLLQGDAAALRALEAHTHRTSEAYQALFEISGIKHSAKGSIPSKIRFVDAETYDGRDWSSAQKILQRRALEWLTSAPGSQIERQAASESRSKSRPPE